ncbi:MAG TPA: helix-turn-helix domain-containing protein [Pyrinomonadaceae bacterium]|nr:helix-turn-helix domain-containing protein [Pyrinomonadaceae bacterium]
MDRRIHTAISLMERQLRAELSLEEIARAVNLSPSRFCHLFKAATGLPPAQYFKALRLSQAKKLLETSMLNIKQIMSRVGIKDKSHFSREFKRAYGLTPKQYRASYPLERDGEQAVSAAVAATANK